MSRRNPPSDAANRTRRLLALSAAGALALVALGLLLAQFWPGPAAGPPPDPRLTYAGPYRNVRPSVRYVGDASCAECHPDQTQSYRKHPMGRSLAPVGDVPLPRDAGPSFDADGVRHTVEQHDGRVTHRLGYLGPDGWPLAEVSAEVAYVVGSGERARSYFVQRDGFLFQSPISWFAQTGKWGPSPGYAGRRVGFARAIEPDCLFCHCNTADPVADTLNRYTPPIFHGHAIGCERCHGPGQLHVADRQEAGTAADTIVNPARLDHAPREAVCEQCHLQGAARVARRGREVFDFRPGLPLDRFWSVYVRPPEFSEQQFVGHVEQMHESRCYLASQGPTKMGCISCHDPHAVPAPEKKVAFYRDRCQRCHEERGCTVAVAERRRTSPEDSCIVCHMPRRASADIDHVATTDHRIPRRAGRAAPPQRRALRPGEIPLRHFHAVNDSEQRRDLGLAVAHLARDPSPIQGQLAETALSLLAEAVRRAPDDGRAWEEQARTLLQQRQARPALASAETALALAPGREAALVLVADAADQAGQRDVSLRHWEQAIAVNPWRAFYRFRRAQLLSEAGDWKAALAECDTVLRLDPASIEMRLLRVAYHLHEGELGRAQVAFEETMRMRPRDPEAIRRWYEGKKSAAGGKPAP